MTKELIIPELGENIESAQIVSIPVKVGDKIRKGDTILEIETGKAVLELPSELEGEIEQLLVAVGDDCKVGMAYAKLKVAEEKSEGDQKTAASAPQQTKPEDTAQPVSAKAATQAETNDKEESTPEPEAAQDDKTTFKPAADVAPVKFEPAEPAAHRLLPTPVHHVPAAPSVRRFARELGVDVDTVKGSGEHGRVSLDDIKRHVRERQGRIAPSATGLSLPPLPDFGKWGSVRSEKMSGIRVATAEHVTQCWINIPRVTHFDEANITNLEALRKKYAVRAEGSGGKLTMAVMVVKMVSLALKKFPKFNASVDMAARQIIYKNYINIGIAVSTERGLMVPVIVDADKKNMVQLAGDIGAVAKKCREGKIKPDELQGGTFTVTNLGGIGGSYFTPIVNFPEVAILGLGRSFEQLTLVDGKPVPQTKLPLSLSYDHRLIDGADAATFVKWIVEAIEEPLLLSLEG